MSTGLECTFIEVEPGQWMLVLEQGSAPKQTWDWREYADSYGMFATEDEAHEFLFKHFANPGGSWSEPYSPDRKEDEVERRLVAQAAKNRAMVERSSLGGGVWRL